jgi:hypothetical protein
MKPLFLQARLRERVLSEETLERAYGAWALARADVARRWNEASDPRALAPRIPKTMRDASDLVRSSRPNEMTQEEADELVERLEDAWPERIQKPVRDAMPAHPEEPVEQVRAIALVVAELGLEPSPPPDPLPAITEEDIHLVCCLMARDRPCLESRRWRASWRAAVRGWLYFLQTDLLAASL